MSKYTNKDLDIVKKALVDLMNNNVLSMEGIDTDIVDFISLSQPKGGVTEAGMACLQFINANTTDEKSSFTANAIGVGLFKSARSVSGSLTALSKNGYLDRDRVDDKAAYNYTITDKGIDAIK